MVQQACNPKNTEYRCHLDGEILADEFIKIACLKLEEA